MAFYQSLQHDLAVAQIPKAGITSFGEWLFGFDVVPNDQVIVSRRVCFIRHPLRRLRSAFTFFHWLDKQGRPHQCGAPVEQWPDFVDHILTADDEHWRPQIEHVGAVPNEWFRFENLADHWQCVYPGIMPHNNKTTPIPVDLSYRLPEVIRQWADDLAAWEVAG